ncbi:hypothetical protein LC653_04145 [Nostoc sp. CHAB 5784]|uniref:hypothetical protein n=1 Tax=Nostoc mirabile TaxID=2907820 RepID=UPI001E367690|nr:hypothetical protein [Nostoc mirabile]MCC5663148.1 hypothetical protein [Nostoc mirabile CHAB5784]
MGEPVLGSGLLSVVPDSGVVGFPGTVMLPGTAGSDGVTVPGAGGVKLLGAPGSDGVTVPGAGGVKLLGAPGSDGATVPGAGGVKLGAVGSDGVTVVPGAGVLSGVADPDPGAVMLSGAVVLSGVLSAGAVVLPGTLGVSAVPPGQRELSGKFSHRIFIPSGDILISVGALVELVLDWAMEDLLDSATAMLAVNAKDKAAPIRLRDFPIIL